jgi:hypothetical protein
VTAVPRRQVSGSAGAWSKPGRQVSGSAGAWSKPEGPVRAPLAGAVVGVAALAVHARALDAPFVWDDRLVILRSPLVLEAHALAAYFRAPFWNERFEADAVRAFFRPVVTLSYRLDYLLGGHTPFVFHLTNILLHTAVTVLLFAWMCRLGAGVLAAAMATLLWALHPRLTESVSWISGRTDVLAMVFMLAALLAWPAWPDPSPRRKVRARSRTAVAAALLLVALLAKEVAIVAVAAVAGTEALRQPTPRAWAARLAPMGVAVTLYAALRWGATNAMPTGESAPHGWPWFMPLSSLGTYALMVVDPRASAQIGDVSRPSAAVAWIGAGVVVAAGLGAWRLVRSHDVRAVRLAAPACLAVLGVAIVMHLVPLPVSVIAADRYLYVPLAGIAAVVALVVTDAPERVRRVALPAGGGLAILLGVLTISRIDDWRDELRFWVVTARSASASPTIALGELANVLYRDRDYTDALPIYRAVANTDSAIGRRNLSNVAASLAMLGRYDEALVIRQALIDADAANPRRYFDAGLVYLHARRFDPARAALGRAVALAPDYEEARRMLAMTSEAEAAWPGVASADDDPARARWLARIGARVEAQRAYLVLLARPGTAPADVLAAAQYLVDEGDLDAAEASVLRAAAAVQAGANRQTVSGLEDLLLERKEQTARIQAALRDIRALVGNGS